MFARSCKHSVTDSLTFPTKAAGSSGLPKRQQSVNRSQELRIHKIINNVYFVLFVV